MKFIEGAPNNIAVKALKRNDDGSLVATVHLGNQIEDFIVTDILSVEDVTLLDGHLKSAFGVFLPALIQKLLNQ